MRLDCHRLSLTLDSEALQNLLIRYFDSMNSIVQRHGGTVEGSAGDDLMAIYGVPTLRENDALRALNTAVDMRECLAALNVEIEMHWGVRLAHRIGINTWEVFTGVNPNGRRFFSGEAVRVAKRLQEAAAPNEVLIGETTHWLVRHAVDVHIGRPRTLKHGEQFPAVAVVKLIAQPPGFPRHIEAQFVGRQRERAIFDTIARDFFRTKTCHLVTVLGEAGVGKSRLVAELTGKLPHETVVARGRCLPYGKGFARTHEQEINRTHCDPSLETWLLVWFRES